MYFYLIFAILCLSCADGINITKIEGIQIGKSSDTGRSQCSGYDNYASQWQTFYNDNREYIGNPQITTRRSCNRYDQANCDVDLVHLNCFDHPVKGLLHIVNTDHFHQKVTWVSCKKVNKPCQRDTQVGRGRCTTSFCQIGNVLVCQGSHYFWIPMSVEDCTCQ
ncbi:unnamed protein product [Gordionus sp. m RMFG-2023]|uniref:uncharacterized protein LOC135923903 n=1 Tax=Gordionus sp. m RMFG-2023 TaxID=3053472 RepID=UPI0030E2D3F0